MDDHTKALIKKQYLKTYNVSEILREFPNTNRRRVTAFLKEEGIFESLNGENYLKAKVKQQESLMMQRHGVRNWGQIPGGRKKLDTINNIPYDKLDFEPQLREYKSTVNKLTKRNFRRMKDIPTHCFYSGIEFADLKGTPNPNDPFKRTIDHKKPIILCYFDGMSVEEAADEANLIFIIRYLNSLKSNTTHEAFLPIAEKFNQKINDLI
jgi:hypothetical protein